MATTERTAKGHFISPTAEEDAAKLLEFLVASAEHGRACPPVAQMATFLRISVKRVHNAYERLRSEKRIAWRMAYAPRLPGGVLRVVTVMGTGKATAPPPPLSARHQRRAKAKGNAWMPGQWEVQHEPDDLCGGRRLQGAEFQRRKAELEARDREERARREAVPEGVWA